MPGNKGFSDVLENFVSKRFQYRTKARRETISRLAFLILKIEKNLFLNIIIQKGVVFMFSTDWIIRQVETLCQILAKMVFHKELPNYAFPEKGELSEKDELYLTLHGLLEKGKINEAEDLLFESLAPEDLGYLELALDFYTVLNHWSDEQLENRGFSREEIEEGLKDAAKLYEITLP